MNGYEFYKDLTYYSRKHFENAKNIGFIDIRNENYNIGKVSDEFKENLKIYIKFATTGFNIDGENIKYKFNEDKTTNDICKINIGKEKIILGYSEIRVLSLNGEVYAAPDKIYYYIEEFSYLPPKEFIDAIEKGISILNVDKKTINDKWLQYYNNYSNFYGENKKYLEEAIYIKNLMKIDKDKFKKEVKSKKFLEIITNEGSLLNCAIKEKDNDLAKYLIDCKININKFSGIELLTAIENNMNDVIRILLEKGIEVRNYSPDINPLFYAIKCNNLKSVELLSGDKRLDVIYKYLDELNMYEFENCIGSSDNAVLNYKGKISNIDVLMYAEKTNSLPEILYNLKRKDIFKF